MMRKSVVGAAAPKVEAVSGVSWLNLEEIASVEVTSEDASFSVEKAFGAEASTGWRAAATGPQVVRLRFDAPQTIRRIQLHFVDRAAERSQEFAIYAGAGSELREVVRQQWSFSPGGATEELEDYRVDLHNVSTLELRIDPDRSHDPAKSQSYASLQRMRLA